MTAPLVDLISDTATRPTAGMYEAIRTAPTGDEQKGEDPTANKLEARAADLLGTETAMLFPTATMANQVALALHAQHGDEIVCHESAHVFNYETGAVAIHASAQLRTVGGARGMFDLATLQNVIRADDPHLPRTACVVVEQTSNGGGGTVWPDPLFNEIATACEERGIALHIDGARLMNAAVKKGVTPAHWGKRVSTVQMCFSKGLGCPFGAVLGMPNAMRHAARRKKQGMGGALRQAGIIAGAMLYALEHHVERLADDHRRAAEFASTLAQIDGIDAPPAETNLVFFRAANKAAKAACDEITHRFGVRMAPTPDGRIRACFHLDIDDDGLARAKSAVQAVFG